MRRTTTMQRKIGGWAAVAVIGGALYLSAAATDDPAPAAAEVHRKRVRVATVEATTASRELRFAGVTRARQRARLSFAVGGRIAARDVEVGDVVREGQVVARLDGRELDNAVASARAAVAELEARERQAARERERAAKLVASKAATAEELERAEAALESVAAGRDATQARLREAERLRDETVLRAPYAGTVTEVLREPGEYASPGQTVVTLAGHGEVELEVEVPESVVLAVAPGDAVTVRLLGQAGAQGGAGPAVTGTVTAVGRTALGGGRLFPVIVELGDTAGIVAGMTAELELAVGGTAALAVPVEAVVNPGGRRPAVFRLRPGRSDAAPAVEKVTVEIVGLLGERVAVSGALEAGDRVVVGGQRGLLDGQAVEVEAVAADEVEVVR